MAYFKRSQVLLASSLLATAMTGCVPAHPAARPVAVRPTPPPPPPPPPPPVLAKFVVLPLDKAALPEKADQVNAKLAAVRLQGAGAPTVATISMETAQLQAECSEPTESCYLKIAKLVEADRLLWAQVDNARAKGKKGKGKPGVKIQVVLFDRDKVVVAGNAEETFAGPVSDEDLDKLIGNATSASAATQAPAPAQQPAPTQAPAAYGQQPAARPVQPAYQQQPTAQPAYQQQPAAQPAYQQRPAAQPTYQQQPAAQPTYQQQPAAQPRPAAQPTYQTQPAPAQGAYQQPAPAAYPPGTAPAAGSPPAATAPGPRYQ
jgi:hypothetical protein